MLNLSLFNKFFLRVEPSGAKAPKAKPEAAPVAPAAAIVAAPPRPAPAPAPPPAPDPMERPARRFIERIAEALPTLDFLVVGETATGRVLASTSHLPDFDPQHIARNASRIMRRKRAAVNELQPDDEQPEVLEDILISLSAQWHLIKSINNEVHFIYLAINSADISLAIARATLVEHAGEMVR